MPVAVARRAAASRVAEHLRIRRLTISILCVFAQSFHSRVVRDAGNLLTRAGFALPTVDTDTITLYYPSGAQHDYIEAPLSTSG